MFCPQKTPIMSLITLGMALVRLIVKRKITFCIPRLSITMNIEKQNGNKLIAECPYCKTKNELSAHNLMGKFTMCGKCKRKFKWTFNTQKNRR